MTLQLDIAIPELPELLREIEGIDELVIDEAVATTRRSVDVIEAAVVQRTPVASGATRQGWGTDVQKGANAVKGVVANPVPHAIFAEKGRAPGKMPPIDPIELWVRRKLGIGQPESRSVAFVIARAIGRRGTKGARMAEEGLAAVRPQVEADFAQIANRVAARFES